MKSNKLNVFLALSVILITEWVYADGRSLDQAAGSAVTTATTFSRAISVLGLLSSSACFNIPGMSGYARKMLGGSVLGAVCSFGGPAIIRMIQGFF